MNGTQYDGMPFGDLNASQRSDIEKTFVDITEVISAKYVQISDLTKAKIVVGRKGSGKTHLLKHIHILSGKQCEVCKYVPLRGDIFSGRGIRTFRGDLSPENVTVLWSELWRVAFLIATLSIFTCTKSSKKALSAIEKVDGDIFSNETGDILKDFRKMVAETYPQIAWNFKYEIDPVVAIEEILKRYTNLNSFNTDFRQQLDINALEEDLSRLLHKFGHVHYIIDGLDELAWADLTGWLDVQRGLFKCVFLLSAVNPTTQYLRTTIAIRNYVYNRSTQDPHGDRTEAHVIKLNWDKSAATNFLNRRLLASANGKFARSDRIVGPRPLAAWLGFEVVEPNNRTSKELVEDYVLRHTRLSPRNIVAILNRLAATQNQLVKEEGIDKSCFYAIVSELARDVAKRMMITTAEELVASMPDVERKLSTRANMSRAQGEYRINMVAEDLELCIASAQTETLAQEEFSKFLSNVFDVILSTGNNLDQKQHLCREIEGILWRSGLIAYRESSSKSWKFSWDDGEFGFARPSLAARAIGFHSSLIDLCGLEAVENEPIF